MSRITQVSYGETANSRYLELAATVDEGEDPMAVYRSLKSMVRKTLGIGPTQTEIDAAIKTLDDAGMVQQAKAPPMPVARPQEARKAPAQPEAPED